MPFDTMTEGKVVLTPPSQGDVKTFHTFAGVKILILIGSCSSFTHHFHSSFMYVM